MWFNKFKNNLRFLRNKASTEVQSVFLKASYSRKNEKGMLPSVESAEEILSKNYSVKEIVALNEESFIVRDRMNWGSARPDNICVYSKDNVKFGPDGITIDNRYEKEGVTGKDWQGKEVQRNYSSGSVETIETFGPEGCFVAVVSLKYAALGAWDGVWLFDRDAVRPHYREIDLFERMSKSPPGTELQFNVHGDVNEVRKQIPVKLDLRSSHHIPEKFLTYTIVRGGEVEIGINAVPIYRTRFAYPTGPMSMHFTSAMHHFDSLTGEDIRFTINENHLTIHKFVVLK
jgi:hypothetical protein